MILDLRTVRRLGAPLGETDKAGDKSVSLVAINPELIDHTRYAPIMHRDSAATPCHSKGLGRIQW